ELEHDRVVIGQPRAIRLESPYDSWRRAGHSDSATRKPVELQRCDVIERPQFAFDVREAPLRQPVAEIASILLRQDAVVEGGAAGLVEGAIVEHAALEHSKRPPLEEAVWVRVVSFEAPSHTHHHSDPEADDGRRRAVCVVSAGVEVAADKCGTTWIGVEG